MGLFELRFFFELWVVSCVSGSACLCLLDLVLLFARLFVAGVCVVGFGCVFGL